MISKKQIPGLMRHSRALDISHAQLRGILLGTRADHHGIRAKYDAMLAAEQSLAKAEGVLFRAGDKFEIKPELSAEKREALLQFCRQDGAAFIVTRPFNILPLAAHD